MKAILLAGGKEKDNLQFNGNKSLVLLKGIPMITYIVKALLSSSYVQQIIIVGKKQELQQVLGEGPYIILEESTSIMDNLLKALAYAPEEERVLIASCDIPLINGEIIANFIEEGLKEKVDVFYPIVHRRDTIDNYPDIKRTYATLREGSFTGGNLILFNPKAINSIETIARHLIQYRKNPIKMCSFFGMKMIVKFFFRRLTIIELQNYIENRFRIKGKAYICRYPEICHDLDYRDDIKIFERYL